MPPPQPAPAPSVVPPAPTEAQVQPSLPMERAFAATGGMISLADSGVGYIDPAIIASQVRVRFDAAYNNVRPDRAEFFYAKCGCFRTAGIDPNAPGPPQLERSVDYQDISTYVELAASDWVSAFVEFPFRFLNPEVNDNVKGIADINFGIKAAVCQSECSIGTFQFRVYVPTGDADRGLGTDHVSLEPAFLFFHRLDDRWRLEAELRDWIAIDGTDFAGNVLRYGVGLSYAVCQDADFSVRPVVELVGWTILEGLETVPPFGIVRDAEGDTIANVKFGVRAGNQYGDVYAGYGRALTGPTWYDEVYRLEFRLFY
jgi:hypothetical protein